MNILDRINKPNDIKDIDREDLPELADEIREFLVSHVSETGGHLAPNLGCVELTMALHRVLDFPEDKLIWDVGHQSYVHKILTGRKNEMGTLRQFGGMSGFPKTSESPCDAFNTGHSSTSISAALGMACARSIKGTNEKIAAVIGDGSFTGGMVYEAMNNMADIKTGCLVVLNDNNMSIDRNVGGMSTYLSKIRVGQQYNDFKGNVEKILMKIPVAGEHLARGLKKSKDSIKQIFVPGMFFEELGVTYIGPIDGHDIDVMEATFRKALKLNRPILVHVKTVKGKGYTHAERHPSYFHGIDPFDIQTGKVMKDRKVMTNTGVFARKLVELGKADPRITAITAAMGKGTGVAAFAAEFPDRAFDVGIAEEHAVTMTAGMAKQGLIPVFAVYSTFFQRGYDMLIHDIAIDHLHAVFCVDRAGLVGDDGETHHGLFDPGFLKTIPGMTVLSPASLDELTAMLDRAVHHISGPVAVRYPRGGENQYQANHSDGEACSLRSGRDITLVTFGTLTGTVLAVADRLAKDGVSAEVIKLNQIIPLPTDPILASLQKTGRLLVAEECVSLGGPGEGILAAAAAQGLSLKGATVCSCGEGFVPHGTIPQLRALCGLDVESLYRKSREVMTYGR